MPNLLLDNPVRIKPGALSDVIKARLPEDMTLTDKNPAKLENALINSRSQGLG